MSDLYRDFIDQKADEIINSLGGTITPAPANAELYRDFLDRKFDDVVNAINAFPKIKYFSYTGDGLGYKNIDFGNDTPKLVLIMGYSSLNNYVSSFIEFGKSPAYSISPIASGSQGTAIAARGGDVTYSGNTMTLDNTNAARSFNITGTEYTVYYI